MADEASQGLASLKQVHRALGMLGRRHALTMDLFRLATEWFEEERLLTEALRLLGQQLDVEAASVIMRDRRQGELYFAAATGPVSQEVRRIRLDPDEGIAGWCMSTGNILRISNVAEEPHWHREVSDQLGFDVRQILAAPINVRNRTIGCLELVNKRRAGDDFQPEDEELIRDAAECVGILFTMRGKAPEA